MAKVNFTAGRISSLECESGKQQTIYWDGKTPCLGIRVTSSGSKSYVFESRLHGKTLRITIGDTRSWTLSGARTEASRLKVMTDRGVDPRKIAREQRAEADKNANVPTLAQAILEYVENKRRSKGGLSLKDRTKADYLAMVEEGATSGGVRKRAHGLLYPLASRPINAITGQEIKALYSELVKHSTRSSAYAMQVLRAVLNWHGVKIPDNPLSKDVPGRDRIILPQSTGNPNPIPIERLGHWWHAASSLNIDGCDYFMFMLLTGARGVEIKGAKYSEGIKICNVDIDGARITLPDTKNRKDHVLLLSRQALEIVKRNAFGKKPDDPLFSVAGSRLALSAINEASGVKVTPHDLRATFATIAEGLVSYPTLKRLINHANNGDVTIMHYIGLGDDQLRAGWQAVADFLDMRARLAVEAPESNRSMKAA